MILLQGGFVSLIASTLSKKGTGYCCQLHNQGAEILGPERYILTSLISNNFHATWKELHLFSVNVFLGNFL